MSDQDWRVYHGGGEPHDVKFPPSPPWRRFGGKSENDAYRGTKFLADQEAIDLVNAALYLRRPLLISGRPGSGKSSLAYSVARELKLGPVLRWSITSSTKLSDGLYHYDAIGRLQDSAMGPSSSDTNVTVEKTLPDIGEYIRLGPLGAALLPAEKPRVLLVDEIDKSDMDFPNDLLHVFEEGEFEIPELVRMSKERKTIPVYQETWGEAKVVIEEGRVRCREFPFVVMTSNEEREFPQAFLRRCLRLEMQIPNEEKLLSIVNTHFGPQAESAAKDLIARFIMDPTKKDVATDQLLNAVYLVSRGVDSREKEAVFKAVLRSLSS
ncbi:ATPase AAA [Reticulibacter mediterranei]|uniref:ATPase AAA n=1 Tax=Reticulibacter mediterranei TaxID=2778369 RepID=A0A8J3IJ57_9CHLR|nr:MoxR family ATPase [Reticulibacter mediterranei]GHO96494.1 ATPase AAA [Reticulibacter mediterranei]